MLGAIIGDIVGPSTKANIKKKNFPSHFSGMTASHTDDTVRPRFSRCDTKRGEEIMFDR